LTADTLYDVYGITNKLKEIIEDVIKNTYDERIYKMLSKEDKRIFKRFIKAVKLDLPVEDEYDKEIQKNYDVQLFNDQLSNYSISRNLMSGSKDVGYLNKIAEFYHVHDWDHYIDSKPPIVAFKNKERTQLAILKNKPFRSQERLIIKAQKEMTEVKSVYLLHPRVLGV